MKTPAAWAMAPPADFEHADSEWLMSNCKVLPCSSSGCRGHDWAKCPFAHPGEKFVRRDLRKLAYQSAMCPRLREIGGCPHGDACEYAHNVFEYWMHPARFRTQLCAYGANCKRTVCFFAHSMEQLRTPSAAPLAHAHAQPASGTESPCSACDASTASLMSQPSPMWQAPAAISAPVLPVPAPAHFALQSADWLSVQDNACSWDAGASSPACEANTLSLPLHQSALHHSLATTGLLPSDGPMVGDLFTNELLAAAEVGKTQEQTIQQQQDTIEALVLLLNAALGRQGLAR